MRRLAHAVGLAALVAAPGARAFAPAEIDAAAPVARAVEADVRWLADDAREGRYPGSDGWLATQEHLIGELAPIADGLVAGAPGDAAYLQHFVNAERWGELVLANVVAVIPGSDLADEYVVVGGHYDHLTPARCHEVDGDDLCNGATDNAAGTAAVLAVARAIAALPAPPRRSIVIALWDAEEYGLIGSQHFVDDDPLVPLEDVVAYVNLDLIGAALAPSARRYSFAVGPESGGPMLQQMTADAIGAVDLEIRQISQIFGQDRSDYVWFQRAGIPFVYFGDSTNACYHSGADEVDIVHFDKLADQAEAAFRLVVSLAEADERPPLAPYVQIDDYPDLVALSEVITATLADLDHVFVERQPDLIALEQSAREQVAAGPESYVVGSAVVAAFQAIDIARFGFPCDAALLPEPEAAPLAGLAALALLGARRRAGS